MKRVGILGGGQLGSMLASAVHALGAEVRIYDPDPDAPAVRRLAGSVVGSWDDAAKLRAFAEGCDVVTFEVEHVDASAIRAAGIVPTPSLMVLETAQDRLREKRWLRDHGFPHVGFVEATLADAEVRAAAFGFPFVLKATRGGYDGRSQWRVDDEESLARALAEARRGGCDAFILEDLVDLTAEASCIVARDARGEHVVFPVFENHHASHVLDWTVVPARFSPAVLEVMQRTAIAIAAALDVVGLLTVELFVSSTPAARSSGVAVDGLHVYVNELAPRPHNSGHVSRRACTMSQFDALARVLVGAPLAPPELLDGGGFAMANLLGEAACAPPEHQPRSSDLLELLLYGKTHAAPRRKMGHVITRGADPQRAVDAALAIRAALLEAATAHRAPEPPPPARSGAGH